MTTKPLTVTPATKIFGCGLNYTDHAKETNQAIPEFPVFFTRFPSSFALDGEAIIRPKASDKHDYEAELVIVIGKTARYVSKEDALDYIAGYSVANDGTLRDWQKRTPQWTLGKNFDKSGALFTHYVPAAELPPGAKGLRVTATLNGTVLQDGNTSDMIFGAAELVSVLSTCVTLSPGDLILTGTPAGVGTARSPAIYLKHGDTIEVAIEKIGTLSNRVIDER